MEKEKLKNTKNIKVPYNPDEIVSYCFGLYCDTQTTCKFSDLRKSIKEYMKTLNDVSKKQEKYNIEGWKKIIVREEFEDIESTQFDGGYCTSYSYEFIFEKDDIKIYLNISMSSDDFDPQCMRLCDYSINYKGFDEDEDENE